MRIDSGEITDEEVKRKKMYSQKKKIQHGLSAD